MQTYYNKEGRIVPINLRLARKVLKVIDAGLCKGMGDPKPGEMCVEAAVNFAMGRVHGDDPPCVNYELRDCKITLNDLPYTTNKARAKALRRLGVIQLGTAGVMDQGAFINAVTRYAIGDAQARAFAALSRWLKREKFPLFAVEAATHAQQLSENDASYECSHAAFVWFSNYYHQFQGMRKIGTPDFFQTFITSNLGASDMIKRAVYFRKGEYTLKTNKQIIYKSHAVNRVQAGVAEDLVQILIKLKVPGRRFLKLCDK